MIRRSVLIAERYSFMRENSDFCCALENRSIIEIQGHDRDVFLQGMITNDVGLLKREPIMYSLMLSPQGKFQFDFFVVQIHDLWLIDIEGSRAQAFAERLRLFKLRSDVSINIATDWQVGVSSSNSGMPHCFVDPRLQDLGYRFYTKNGMTKLCDDRYRELLLSLGIPDGAHDMIIDKSIPLEWGMDELHAISWDKGCYLGQELTARSRYVGQIRKRVFPITFPVLGQYKVGDKLLVDDCEVGELRAVSGNVGLAMVKLEALNACININGHIINVHKPSWMILPE